jgi:hypothetical protein
MNIKLVSAFTKPGQKCTGDNKLQACSSVEKKPVKQIINHKN